MSVPEVLPEGRIERINGSLIIATFPFRPKIGDAVEVGNLRLLGEIVRLSEDKVAIQCYESTSGIKPGEPVIDTGKPLAAELGPGLMGGIFDGLGRSERELWTIQGSFITRGAMIPPLNREVKWEFVPKVKPKERVVEGDVIGTVQETPAIEHRILIPVGLEGVITDIKEGKFAVTEPVAILRTKEGEKELTMMQTWPIRTPRPYKERIPPAKLLVTGQRVIDTFFPIVKGGTVSVPGGFGTGKTVLLQQIAKWADTDIVIYVGCGERGNEMADVVSHFPELEDPRTGRKLIERTIIVANVSNMPVSAREASVYLGITIGEYYRDQGYDVGLMADSTSRWAEAIRDISGRLEEMPVEGGYPAYLADRIAEFYERAGRVVTLGSKRRIGSVTIMGAVSPPGGDFSEPVTTHTSRFIAAFWALETELAFRRHFPAIHWLKSYSKYLDVASQWWEVYEPDWSELRSKAMKLLEEASKIEETARIIGESALPDEQRLILLISEMIREGFLVQSAYHEVDTYCEVEKQCRLLRALVRFYDLVEPLIRQGIPVEKIRALRVVPELMRVKETKGTKEIERLEKESVEQVTELAKAYEIELEVPKSG